jgi:hypothetical protein
MARKKKETEGRAHLVAIFGSFNSKALVMVPADLAKQLVDEAKIDPAPAFVIDAVLADLASLKKRDSELAGSALAMSALTMAYEMSNPYTSATAKSMCAKALTDAMKQLRDLAPPAKEADAIDDLADRRAQRLAGAAAAEDLSRP